MRRNNIESFAVLLRKSAPCELQLVPKHRGLHRLAFAEDVF
jgi:hypothetical protein